MIHTISSDLFSFWGLIDGIALIVMYQLGLMQCEEQDSQTCRICFEGEEEGTLASLCQCRGTVAWVHLHCQKEFLRHKYDKGTAQERSQMEEGLQCEICNTPYTTLYLGVHRQCSSCKEIKERMQANNAVFFDILFFLVALGAGIFLLLAGIANDSFWYMVLGIFWIGLAGVVLMEAIPRAFNRVLMVPRAEIIEGAPPPK